MRARRDLCSIWVSHWKSRKGGFGGLEVGALGELCDEAGALDLRLTFGPGERMPFALPLAGLGCRERLPNGLGRASPRGLLYPANRFRFFIDVTIRRPRERRLGALLGGPAITFPTPPASRTVYIGSFPIRSPDRHYGKYQLGHCHIGENN